MTGHRGKVPGQDGLSNARYHDEEPHEHHEQRPVYLPVNFFRLHGPRDEQQSTGDDGDLGRGPPGKEKHEHDGSRNNKSTVPAFFRVSPELVSHRR